VIFGQEAVVEQGAHYRALRRARAADRPFPALAKTKLIETMGIVLGLDAPPHPVHPRSHGRSDILGSEVLDESPGGKRSFPIHPRSDLRPVCSWPMRSTRASPAHPIRAAAGDAGAPRDGRRQSSRRFRAPFHVLRDAETRSSRRAPIRFQKRNSIAS